MFRAAPQILLLASLVLSSGFWGSRADAEQATSIGQCRYTREFITTLEFLRSHKELALSENQARDLADRVASGCTGAAQRFIRTFEMLNKVEAGTRVALQIGLELASKSDAHVSTFGAVFRRAFLRSHLDLDLATSLRIARSLSFEYQGDVKVAETDFEGLVHLCRDQSQVGLSLPQCAAMAARVAKRGEGYPGGILQDFRDFYTFLRTEPTISMNISEALQVSEEVVARGQVAVENFKLGYNYALHEKGLSLPAQASLNKAREMAYRASGFPVPQPTSQRLPALVSEAVPSSNSSSQPGPAEAAPQEP